MKTKNFKNYLQKVDFYLEKVLYTKSRLLLEKGATYLCDIDCLMLTSEWYIKDSNHIYRFKLDPKIIDNYTYKYKFWDTIKKTIRDGQIYLPYSQFLGKGFNFEKAIKSLNLTVRLNEEQTLIKSFFLHRSPKCRTEDLNFFLGKAYYRDINLYFVYNRQYKQWLSSGPEFFNETICEKVRNKNFNLKTLARQYYHARQNYHVEKKENDYAIGHLD